jgi:hypothetical protein
MITNTVFTITCPDIRPTVGPTTMLLGVSEVDLAEYLEIYDSMYPDIELVNYLGEKIIDDENLAWHMTAASLSGTIFVNLEHATREDIYIAFAAEHLHDKTVFWIGNEKSHAIAILIAHASDMVFANLEEVDTYLMNTTKIR